MSDDSIPEFIHGRRDICTWRQISVQRLIQHSSARREDIVGLQVQRYRRDLRTVVKVFSPNCYEHGFSSSLYDIVLCWRDRYHRAFSLGIYTQHEALDN